MDEDIPLISEREVCDRGGRAHPAEANIPAVGVGFGFLPVKDQKKTDEAGRPMFREVEFCKIVVPGDKQSLHLQPARDIDRQKYPRAYQAFKNRETTPLEGTPIEQWPLISRAEAMSLKAINIFTVEMLSHVNDANASKMGHGARELIAKARNYVATAKDSAAAVKLAEENLRKDEQIAELQRQISELAARMDEPKRGPGRPRKDEQAAA